MKETAKLTALGAVLGCKDVITKDGVATMGANGELGITDKDVDLPISTGGNLYQKLIRVMQSVEHLEKRGVMKAKNRQGDEYTQYKYLKASDMFDAIRPLFVREKLILLPELLKQERWDVKRDNGGVLNYINVTYRFHIIDAETRERDHFDGSGSGMDSGDKSAQKAALVALKYALRNTFLVADDSDDGDAPQAEAAKKTRKTSDKRKFELIKGRVTELRVMGEKTVWLRLEHQETWIRSVNVETSVQLRNAQDCLVELTAYWDKQKGKSGEEADVMTVTRVAGVWESRPKTGWAAQKPEDESQDDPHISPDMRDAGFKD